MIGFEDLALSAPLSYLAAFWLPALDAVLPILPSETVLIALGVATAGSADPRIAVLLFIAACGAFAGDNLAYMIGRRFGPAADRRFFAGERGIRRRAWAQQMLDRFGIRLIIACRFIPGGRTAVTVTCGIIGFSRRSFVIGTACAAVIWVSYAYLLGRIGGAAFEDKPWAGFLVGLGGALVLSALIEAVRRVVSWRSGRRACSADGSGTGSGGAAGTSGQVPGYSGRQEPASHSATADSASGPGPTAR